MLEHKETIAAISTPTGRAGIGAIRVSGKNSKKIFVKMYRSLTSKIHPDKFANRETTPEVEEKISYFKFHELLIMLIFTLFKQA